VLPHGMHADSQREREQPIAAHRLHSRTVPKSIVRIKS
jgi:hypothetical protein